MRHRKLRSYVRLPLMILLWLFAGFAVAQVPQTLNYQGYLTNAASQPVNAAVNVTFRLYATSAGGAPVWTETQSGIGVTNGVFSAVLGKSSPMSLPFNVPYFLSLQVNGDAEMGARQPLSSVPYALRAVSADGLAAGATIPASQLTGTISSSQLSATQLLPTTACAANFIPQWNGMAWMCAAGMTGQQGPQGLQGLTGLAGPVGPAGPQGLAGSVDAATNLTLPASTASEGNILKVGTRFIHNYGFSNTFVGKGAGNFAMTGSGNAGFGENALAANTSGAGNTATGRNALFSNMTGELNTAMGAYALNGNINGNFNTATGHSALLTNWFGNSNTATGALALQANSSGNNNTAIGANALSSNVYGSDNTASGKDALRDNKGSQNTALGTNALRNNTTGSENTAVGMNVLANNNGSGNTAIGGEALLGNVNGSGNTAIGGAALLNGTGNNNIALGGGAGQLIAAGSNNIMIGNNGAANDAYTIRIGGQGGQSKTYIAGIWGTTVTGSASVFVNGEGLLGYNSSSRRYKDNIVDMDAASSALMRLRPVMFHYKSDQNPAGRTLQYGLIAEEVADIYPGLIAHSADGQIETVMYQHLPPMLLNEFQKQHRTIDAQATELAQLRAKIAALERHSTRQEAIERELNRIKERLGLE